MEDFPPAPTKSRWVCSYCLRLEKEKTVKKGELLQRSRDQLSHPKAEVNIGAIADLAAMFMEAFGGMREFVEGTVAQLYAAEENDPGSARALNMRMNIAKLFVRSAEVVEQVNDVGKMSDAELATAIARLAKSGAFEHLTHDDDEPPPQLESPAPAGGGPPGGGSAPQEGAAAGVPSDDGNP